MTLRWLAITCDAQRLLTKSQMWGKLWHATVQAGGWVGVRSGREKRLLGKTPQTAPPGQDRNVVNAATKVDPRAMAEPGSRYPATNFRCAVPFETCTPCDDPHTVWQLSLVSVVSAGCWHASMRATAALLMCPRCR